jgi:hypothetical protein
MTDEQFDRWKDFALRMAKTYSTYIAAAAQLIRERI